MKRFIAMLMCCCVVISMFSVTASATSFVGTAEGNTLYRLGDGHIIRVPSPAISSGEFIVIRRLEKPDRLNRLYQYLIINYADADVVYDSDVRYAVYRSGEFATNGEASDCIDWKVQWWQDQNISLKFFLEDGDYSVVASTFDMYDSVGNLVVSELEYKDDYDNIDGVVDGSVLNVSPSLSIPGMLPAVDDILENTGFSNWLVYRKAVVSEGLAPTSFKNGVFDENNHLIINDDTKFQYFLLVFSDDFNFTTFGSNYGSSSCKHYRPIFRLDASVIYDYRLYSSSSDDGYTFDVNTIDNAKSMEWSFNRTNNDYYTSMFETVPYEEYADFSAFSDFMNSKIVASSDTFFVEKSADTYDIFDNWPENYYFNSYFHGEEDHETYGPISQYTIPMMVFNKSVVNIEGNGSFGGETDEVSWLKKIYYSMVEGFNSVIDAIGNITGIGGGNDEIIEDKPADEDFSLLDIFKNIFGFAKDIIFGFFGFLFDGLNFIGDAISDFFKMIADGTSEIFAFFSDPFSSEIFGGEATIEDGDDTNDGVTSFYGFLGNFWYCIPPYLRSFILMVGGMFLIIYVFKLFHR